MSCGTIFKGFGAVVFILAGLLDWTEGKSNDFYKPPDNPLTSRESNNSESFRTQQTINALLSLVNSTLGSIPSKLNSTLNSIPSQLNSTLNSIPTTINSVISKVLTTIISCLTSALNIITSLTSSLGGLSSLFEKPSGGGGGGGFLSSIVGKLQEKLNTASNLVADIFDKANGTGISLGGSPCKPVDLLTLYNIPGIFIGVPLVILGISILVGAIAAVIVAIGGLGEHITDHIYEETDFENISNNQNHNSKIDGTAFTDAPYGKLKPQSVASFTPSSNNHGFASSPWRYADIEAFNKDFNKAYDKYSAMSQQQGYSQNDGNFEQAGVNTNSKNQHWSSNHVARRKQ